MNDEINQGIGGYIFISHSHKDIKKVREIRNAMEAEGFEPLCFFLKCLTADPEIENLIYREIEARDWFVFVDSENARKSEWVKKERAFIEKTNDNKIITIDLESEFDLTEFAEKLMSCMRVLLLYSSGAEAQKTKDKIKAAMSEKDIMYYEKELEKHLLQDGYEDYQRFGCVILVVSKEEMCENAGSISNLVRYNESVIIALVGKSAANESGIAEMIPDRIPWIYIGKNARKKQAFKIADKIEEYMYGKYGDIEDSRKLSHDYDELRKRYSEEEFVFSGNNTKNRIPDCIIPVVKSADIAGKRIVINDNDCSKYRVPSDISKYSKRLMKAHRASSVYNNLNIRIKKWSVERESFIIDSERTTYYSTLKTNRAMDYSLNPSGDTVRSLLEPGPRLNSLEKSKLSNHLGFNGMIETADNYFFLVFRKRNLSVGKMKYGCSVSASLKTKYALNQDGVFDVAGLFHSIKSEIKDEVGIEPNNEPIIVNAYRNAQEGGKPELFFYYKSDLTKSEISTVFIMKEEKTQEEVSRFLSREQKIRNLLTDGDSVVWIKKEDLIDRRITRIYCDRIETVISDEKDIRQRTVLPMLPSTTACLCFLRDYIKGRGGK